MKNPLRFWLGLAIILVGLSLPTLEKAFVPTEPSVREVLSMTKPSDELIAEAEPLDDVITDKKDEESFSVFNNEFSSRVDGYDTKGEIILRIYSGAVEEVFGKELKEKYDGEVGIVVRDALKEVIGDFDTPLSDDKQKELKEKFSAYSWVLGGDENE